MLIVKFYFFSNLTSILQHYILYWNLGTTAADNFQEKNTTKCLKLNHVNLENSNVFHDVCLILFQPAVFLVPVTWTIFPIRAWPYFAFVYTKILFLWSRKLIYSPFPQVLEGEGKPKNRCTRFVIQKNHQCTSRALHLWISDYSLSISKTWMLL